MKYPIEQYNILIEALKTLSKYIENLKDLHPANLQFLVYQQFCKGQSYNAFHLSNGVIYKKQQIDAMDLPDDGKLITKEYDFKLYPNGCNDNHITTAVKRAIIEASK